MGIFDDGRDAMPSLGPNWTAFQERWSRRLREEFPALRHVSAKEHRVPDDRRALMRDRRDMIAPDHVVVHQLIEGSDKPRVLLVADAKFRAKLTREDVEILDYAIALGAEEGCRIYVPRDCKISSTAKAVEHEDFEVEILVDEAVSLDMGIDPEFLHLLP